MEYIIFVAKEGNITKAAQKLHIAQPSLSQTIRMAEEEIGLPIFQRHSHPLKLTYAGERYVTTSQRILQLRDDMFHEFKDINEGMSGKVTVGVSLRRSREIISGILMQLSNSTPKLDVQLSHEKSLALEQMLLHGNVDVAFMNFKSIHPQIESIQLCDEELLLAVSPNSPLSRELASYQQFSSKCVNSTPVPTSFLRSAKLVLLKEGTYSREQCNKIFWQGKIIPQIYMETENTELALGIAEATGICSIFPHVVKAQDLSGANLCLYRLDSQYAKRSFYLAYNNSRYISPAEQSFIDVAISLLK